MMPGAKDSFVLFDVGHDESVLRLGDLVLHNYKDPLAARHYTCRQLPASDATVSTRLSKFSIFHKHGPRTGLQLQLAGFVNLGATFAHEKTRLLIAESAERITLRSPTSYLSDVVLADKSALAALSIWLSASFTERLRKFKSAGKPKIWMMTGMYMFENVKVVTTKHQNIGTEIGLSSELLTALTTVPVGASLSGCRGASAEISMEILDRKVWAAQYQLLNVEHITSSRPAPTNTISTITLYPDITSKGLLRNAKANLRASSVGPFDETVGLANDAQEDARGLDANEEGFVDALYDMVSLYEEELQSDSSGEQE